MNKTQDFIWLKKRSTLWILMLERILVFAAMQFLALSHQRSPKNVCSDIVGEIIYTYVPPRSINRSRPLPAKEEKKCLCSTHRDIYVCILSCNRVPWAFFPPEKHSSKRRGFCPGTVQRKQKAIRVHITKKYNNPSPLVRWVQKGELDKWACKKRVEHLQQIFSLEPNSTLTFKYSAEFLCFFKNPTVFVGIWK